MFVELRLPDLVELVQFLREETAQLSGQPEAATISEATLTNLGAHCRVSLWRKRGSRCDWSGGWQGSRGRIASRFVRREATAGESRRSN